MDPGEADPPPNTEEEDTDVGDTDGVDTDDVLENLKKSFKKLLSNEYDQFEVLSLAQKLSVDVINESSFSQMKYIVQKSVLEQILKSESSERYKRHLEETMVRIQRKEAKKYLCCLVGCLFEANKHQEYLYHMKRVHSTHNQFVCHFQHTCCRQFSTVGLLTEHVREFHTRVKPSTTQTDTFMLNIACKCNLISCGGLNFPSIEKLMTHIVNFHSQEDRECVFEGCSSKFSSGITSTARHHFLNKHKKVNKLQLKPKYVVNLSSADPTTDMQIDPIANVDQESEEFDTFFESDLYTEEEMAMIDDEENDDDTDKEKDTNYFMMQYADFLNRLSHFKFIPYKTVQEIANEFLENSLKSQKVREKKLRKSLNEIPTMTVAMIEKIVQDVVKDDDNIKAQKEFVSEYKRIRFIHENFKYVPPIEIVLNKESVLQGEAKDCIHYIPVTESFKHLIEDKSLNDVLEKEREKVRKQGDTLKDFTDGSAFKENPFFQNNPGAFAGHFYSDSVELSNPLGAAKGKHKINQVFYTVGQIPKEQRSKIDRMQLCMVFKDKLVKLYGYIKL